MDLELMFPRANSRSCRQRPVATSSTARLPKMKRRFTARLARWANRRGYEIRRLPDDPWQLYPEATAADREVISAVLPFTMTPPSRIWNLLKAVDYVLDEGVDGAMVECGVWRGGSVMAMALRLLQRGRDDRELWLFDTFEGMTPPTDLDVEAATGRTARQKLEATPYAAGWNIWAYAPRHEVEANLATTGYPAPFVHFVEGDVASTVTESFPDMVAILRLDSDFYESTLHELEGLFPRLAVGGVLIIDDYGHWEGARRATDEFFANAGMTPLLVPVDTTCRIMVKTRG